MAFANIRTLFFDYDGTLHNGIKIYAPAFNAAYSFLVEKGLAAPKNLTEKEISCWLGFNPMDMWDKFMPGLDADTKSICINTISSVMKSLTEEGKAELYMGAEDVLEYLKGKGYKLIFISNCKNYFKDAHKKIFRLDRYFDDFITSEDFGFISKSEILALIKDNYLKEMAIIGDRMHDINAGKENGFLTIGCSYGYGNPEELKNADLLIDNIIELKNVF